MQLFTKELAERLGSEKVTANCLDPGTVNTKMLYAGWGACGIDLKVRPLLPSFSRTIKCYLISTVVYFSQKVKAAPYHFCEAVNLIIFSLSFSLQHPAISDEYT